MLSDFAFLALSKWDHEELSGRIETALRKEVRVREIDPEKKWTKTWHINRRYLEIYHKLSSL